MVWRDSDPQGGEALKIRHLVVPYTRGTGLDLGCGPWPVWPHAIGVDNFDEYSGLAWQPDVVGDVLDLKMFADESMDFVFSSHLLEHLEDTETALRHWWSKIKDGGYLILYLPHKDLYPNMGEDGANPDHLHDFTEGDIVTAMKELGSWDLVECQKRDGGMEYSFLMVFKKATLGDIPGYGLKSYRKRNPDKKPTLFITRYGGFGDMIVASAILPQLKEAGYWIVFNTTPRGYNVLREDPHIDEFFLQDKDQVPNVELAEYWMALSGEFDRCINLSETVEGALLAIEGRRDHALSHRARHKLKNVNYMEFTFDVADLDYPEKFEPRFYSSVAENVAMAAFRLRLGARPVILWALAGSSVHKAWPWVDQVITRMFREADYAVVFCGDEAAKIIEHAVLQVVANQFLGMEHEKSHEVGVPALAKMINEHFNAERIVCTAGDWSIRDTLALVPYVDLVIGPETGVLNAASHLPVPTICMLSHSSHENLTKHWINTITLEPVDIHCYPCHRLHSSATFCNRDDDSGAAICAASISAFRMWQEINNVLNCPTQIEAAE